MKYLINGRIYDTKSLANLIKFNDMSPEKHKQISSNGGKKSGELRRRKKILREHISEVFEMEYLKEQYSDNEISDYRRWKRNKAYRERKKAKKCR